MSDKKLLIKSVVTGTLCGILTCIILMCILSAVMLSVGLLPAAILDYAMIAILAAGAFVGGFIATKINKGAGLIVGALTGTAIMLIIAIAALSRGDLEISALLPIKLAVAAAGGALGGILGLRERSHISI